MKVRVVYDADGTTEITIKGKKVSSQLFRGSSTALVKVYNKKGRVKKAYHFSKVYFMENTAQ